MWLLAQILASRRPAAAAAAKPAARPTSADNLRERICEHFAEPDVQPKSVDNFRERICKHPPAEILEMNLKIFAPNLDFE